MLDNKIKKIVDRLYEFDFEKSELIDGNEIIATDTVSEFVMAFRKRDLEKGIIITPSGYTKGLVFKSSNGGEFYNHPNWIPDIVNFSLNIFGLKKNSFYKLTVIARDTGISTTITGDRSLFVSNDEKEVLLNENVKGEQVNKEYHALFRASSNENNLFFKIGKIFINNIIIEEVELLVEETPLVNENVGSLSEGKLKLAAFGVFSTEKHVGSDYKGRYILMTRYTGKGINLYYDTVDSRYIIERDNAEDIIGENFVGVEYILDINMNKVINKDKFSTYVISEVSSDISPNTLRQGYIAFELVDKNYNKVDYNSTDGKITIIVNKLY
jgi:hypothetical protein